MKYINKEEIAKAIRDGKGINIEEILDEFKGMLREVYQTATEVELTDHLGYEKHTKSDNPHIAKQFAHTCTIIVTDIIKKH